MQLRSSKKTHYSWRYVRMKFVTHGHCKKCLTWLCVRQSHENKWLTLRIGVRKNSIEFSSVLCLVLIQFMFGLCAILLLFRILVWLTRHCQDVTQSGKTELYWYAVPVKMSLTDTSVYLHMIRTKHKYLSLVKQNWGIKQLHMCEHH